MASRRTWISGLLALAGTVTFWAAMGMDGIGYREIRTNFGTMRSGLLGTWTLPFTSPELAPVFIGCALAPFGWMAAAWARSPWARGVSAMIVSTAALLLFGLGAMPGAALEFAKPFTMWLPGSAPYLGGGWWTLGVAAALLSASFLTLPPPERPEAGEDLPPEVVRTARTRTALVTALAAGVGVVALARWFHTQQVTASYVPAGWPGARVTWALPVPVFGRMLEEAPLLATLYLLTPLLFLVALRWRVLRLPTSATAAATICAMLVTKGDGYWQTLPQDPAPLALGIWYLVPGALLVAALVLPPSMNADAPRCPAPAPAA